MQPLSCSFLRKKKKKKNLDKTTKLKSNITCVTNRKVIDYLNVFQLIKLYQTKNIGKFL